MIQKMHTDASNLEYVISQKSPNTTISYSFLTIYTHIIYIYRLEIVFEKYAINNSRVIYKAFSAYRIAFQLKTVQSKLRKMAIVSNSKRQ